LEHHGTVPRLPLSFFFAQVPQSQQFLACDKELANAVNCRVPEQCEEKRNPNLNLNRFTLYCSFMLDALINAVVHWPLCCCDTFDSWRSSFASLHRLCEAPLLDTS
jgi:hypothetical protein